MLTKMMQSVFALTILAGIGYAACEPAHAGDGGRVVGGVAIGTLLGLGIAGAYDRPRYYAGDRYYYGGGCYAGPRRCEYVGRSCWYNRWGEYICSGGEQRCWRQRICD